MCLTCRARARSVVMGETICTRHKQSAEEGPDLAMSSKANGKTRGVGREHCRAVSGKVQSNRAQSMGCN